MNYKWIEKTEKPRIVTHRDTDGIMSAVLVYSILKNKNVEIVTTDYDELDAPLKSKKKFYFTPNDIVVDLPQPDIDVVFWSDHHSRGMRHDKPKYPHLYDGEAPSCASLLYNHFVRRYRSLKKYLDLVQATDMIDSASYPDAKYQKNINNYGNKIRLGLDVGSKVHDNVFYKPALIRAIVDARDWRSVLDNPLHMSRVHTSLSRYKEYEESAIKYFLLKGRVVYSDFGKKFLPGLINRYYAFEVFPEAHYSLSIYVVNDLHRIVISLNAFNKNASSNQFNLGEIANRIHPKGGGHHGIGVIPGVSEEKKQETISDLLDLLNGGQNE